MSEKIDPLAFAYDRSPGYEQRTFDEHNANVIKALRTKVKRLQQKVVSQRRTFARLVNG